MRITDHIAHERMSGLQIRAVIVAIALVVLDGYDVSLTSFAAPYIEKGFGVSKAELGLVMSGALIGMLVGSIIVAPLADRIGRRKMGVISAATIAIGMFIGPFATRETGTGPLVVSRIVTGVGLGCLVAVAGVILAEYTGKRVYSLVMAVYAAAINIGGLLGSMIVGPMLGTHGWQFGWWAGFALSAIAALATFALLPESLAWLSEGRRPDSLQRLNALLTKMGRPALEALPEPDSTAVRAKGSLRTVFTGRTGFHTLLMIVGYLAYMLSFYFMTNWAPSTVADAHHNPALAPQLVTAFSIGGILGNVLFGFLGDKLNVRLLAPVFLILATATLALFGIAGPGMPAAWWTLFLASFFVCAGTAAFYAIVPTLYPTLARSTGFGVVIGVGRFGGIAAPIVGGAAFDAGMGMGGGLHRLRAAHARRRPLRRGPAPEPAAPLRHTGRSAAARALRHVRVSALHHFREALRTRGTTPCHWPSQRSPTRPPSATSTPGGTRSPRSTPPSTRSGGSSPTTAPTWSWCSGPITSTGSCTR